MNFIVTHIKWIMLVSGALTCSMVLAAVTPQAALLSNFGQTLEGPVAEIVVRNWGILIALIGAMLVYGAFHPPVRGLVLTVAGLSKLAFITLVLWQGAFAHQAAIAVVIDSLWVLVFALYLLSPRKA